MKSSRQQTAITVIAPCHAPAARSDDPNRGCEAKKSHNGSHAKSAMNEPP